MPNKIENTEPFDSEDEETETGQDTILSSPPVPQSFAKTRLDKWLSLCFTDISRTNIIKLINEGRLTKNAEIINNAAYKIKENEIFTLCVSPPAPPDPIPQNIPLDIMYEDDDIIVVNKTAGMVVHPGAGNWENTLVNALLFHANGHLSGIGGLERAGIVHRIDKDTSGILVVAKNDFAHKTLAEQFSTHNIERVYEAVCFGVPNPLEGTISGNIGRNPNDRKKMAIVKQGGKTAVTHYKTLQILAGSAAGLIECRLETGRTHQIRVHMTSIGHPLVGDSTYRFDRKFSKIPLSDKQKKALYNFPRQALHAKVLGFIHPTTKKNMLFETDMPEDMKELCIALSENKTE